MNEHIQQMIDWIERNLKKGFSLDELSRYMGYSPYYCSFKFHQVTGFSMRRYILLRRLYLSTEDLKNGRKIIEIALITITLPKKLIVELSKIFWNESKRIPT